MGDLPFLVLFNFISYQTGNMGVFFPTSQTHQRTRSLAAQGRPQKLKLAVLHGGFVFLSEGREFTVSGVMS